MAPPIATTRHQQRSLFPPTCTTSEQKKDNSYAPTPSDVFSVRIMLLHLVPTELANMIITAAEYWPKLTASREAFDGPAVVSGKDDKDQWCYIASGPIPKVSLGGVDLRLKVKRVKFTVSSCYEEPSCEGLQSTGANSWLEAAVLTSSPSSPHPELDSVEPTFKVARRWHIQSNKTLRTETDIIWDANDSDHTTQSPDAPDIDPVTGSGTGQGFISSLACGDRVAVMTRDLYRGWVNCIYTVKLDVYYAV